MKRLLILGIFIIGNTALWGNPEPDTIVVYKKIDGFELKLHMFFPENHDKSEKVPSIVFFHGGGWKGGGVAHFYNQAAYFATRGLIAISAQYRVEKPHGTTPKECVKDAKSAMRWIRSHATVYGIDPNRILAGGGSAGGHVAAAVSTIDGFNEDGEDLSVSCIPKALMLFNPVANNSKEGYGYDRVKDYWKAFSPAHNLKKGTPPTLIMLGTKDQLFKIDLAKQYKADMEALGNRCDLILYQGQDHAFFNIDRNKELHFQTMIDVDVFLSSLGYLQGEPTVDEFRKTLNQYK
ncbi:alpha/beta hydrolase [Algibacter mikhailovii]|uniref:Lipase n=1 Tax=Algibacter mikhailovii TaxID=425498 RepID=A0A918R7F3_9FLAO|nr:alpha/beta hydrolase fold domain-containing protein [Algibacter mikhailovii]GGZ87523.1 lipase [Algibacter mikhailovii]